MSLMTTAHSKPNTGNPETDTPKEHGFLELVDVDHVELYVGNAKQSAFFYAAAFGFTIKAYKGLETGCRTHSSYLLEQGNIRLLLTSALDNDHPAARHCSLFGDGVKDVAFTVRDAESAYDETTKRGGRSAVEPMTTEDEHGKVTRSAIYTYGEVQHSFVDRSHYKGIFLPGFIPIDLPVNRINDNGDCGLAFIDHVVGNVEDGKMNEWVKWYEDVMGFTMFKHFDDADISTEYSALMSKVMSSGRGLIKMPINEPAEGKRKSQIQEYLDWHNNTPGVQHIALRTQDELNAVARLRDRGVEFLRLPDTYYDLIWDRVGEIEEDRDKVKQLGILVDRDDKGYLLQIFTKPVQDRPTLFFEIITRRGSESFGKGNFKALFEALELEQQRRGNL
ncbi:MAG: 4-hydroxyphenylpyruvate dioxygenase [Planctomycetota bacterium]